MMSSSEQPAGIGAVEAADAIAIDALMQANIVRVFNERSLALRRAALDELYTEGTILMIPRRLRPAERRSAAVDHLLRMLPSDFVFTAIGRAVGHNGAARLF
jgi:hypothetical protein